uniref:Uncharacterized protein n=1 Tax=Schistosoma japonicum TaxID=6182 RepID=Q5BYV4_SCHJA|nr:unknown [Schistosoma japonicum]
MRISALDLNPLITPDSPISPGAKWICVRRIRFKPSLRIDSQLRKYVP